LAINAKGDNS
jgi:hypothetical protein